MNGAVGVGLWGLACAQPVPLSVQAEWVGDGVELHASAPVDTLTVLDATGVPILRQALAAPAGDVFVALDGPVGAVQIAVTGPSGAAQTTLVVPLRRPWSAEVQPAPGSAWVPARGRVEVPVWGASASIFVRFTAGPSGVDVPSDLGPVHLASAGSRSLVPIELTTERTLRIGDDVLTLVPVRRDPEVVSAGLHIEGLVFPADAGGLRDLGRPIDAVPLPSPIGESALARLGWGARIRADGEPWAFVAVPLSNASADPIDLVVSAVVEDTAGQPVAAMRPRLRSADGGSDRVVALVRVPAGGRVDAVLPVFVDVAAAVAGEYRLSVSAAPLGSDAPLLGTSTPLVVRRGDAVASSGFFATLMTSALGLGWTLRRLPRWLRAASTTDLMVNALFGTTLFVVSTATDILAMSVGAVLGPFATLLTGVLYDAGRTVLLATLLQLQPRPGTIALSILCSWLGRGVLMGTIGPPDLIYTGAAIALGEAFGWLSGITRGRPIGFGRLVVAFAPANALLTVAGLWLHTVLYRLHFANWYILLQVALPGFLYVLLACWLAVPFARSLGEVDA